MLRSRMTEPYQAIGLVPTMWGIRRREEIAKNLDHLEHLVKAAFWLGGLDLPVRLVAIPEGALQGFTDEVMDTDHEDVRARVRDRHSGTGDRAPRRARAPVGHLRHGPGQGPPRGVPGALLQRRSRHRPAGRGDPAPSQGGAAAAGGALHDAAQRLGPLGGALRRDARRVLPGGRHRDRAAGDHDGQRGLVSRERARAGHERGRGRLPGLLPASRERRVRAADARAGARQQHVRGRAEPRHLSPHGRLGHARSTRSAASP